MQLIADRFVEDDHGRVFDAATRQRVVLIDSVCDTREDRSGWAARCDLLHMTRQRALAPLVDFGAAGSRGWFEAWGCGIEWAGATADAVRVQNSSARFLRNVGLPDAHVRHIYVGPHGPLVIPCDVGASIEEVSIEECSPEDCGIISPQLPIVSLLAAIFDPAAGMRPRICGLWGPPGSGRSIVVHQLARIARIHGFAPVDAELLDGAYAQLWRDRSLFVIARNERAGRDALVRAVCRNAVPHVILIVAAEEPHRVPGVALKPIAAAALVASVIPMPTERSAVSTIEAAARKAAGLPRRFAELLWRVHLTARRRPVEPKAARVAESPAVYGVDAALDATSVSSPPAVEWPSPAELVALRRRAEAANRLLVAGRHAPGTRQLRQAISGLARRDAWIDAAGGAIALARALRRRGRVREAHATLDEARRYATRAGSDALLLDIAILSGETWTDRTRLDEAETTLAAAVTAARAAGDAGRAASASIALARCLFWRGRYADAGSALPTPIDDWPDDLRLQWGTVAARVRIGERDISAAFSVVQTLTRIVEGSERPEFRAQVGHAAAFVHLAASDLDAAARFAAAALDASRAARDPLRAIKLRLLIAEETRRRGNHAAAASMLRRLDRHVAALSPIVAAHAALLRDVIASPDRGEETLERVAAATGLRALALFVDVNARATSGGGASDIVIDGLIDILRTCQTATDEAAVVKDVCARVRRQLRSLGVACFLLASGGRELLASDGSRFDPITFERVASTGVVIAPHNCDGRVESAAPVQYGGTTIGALFARWPLGTTEDITRAATILSMTATAIAPVLSSAAARRHQPPSTSPELLGTTAVMVEVRRAVERAAAAPFPVLIEGESGSGKELVARAIHRRSGRRERPFCSINCAALPDDLIEAELFGHARGAFTGAVADRAGVFEEAHGGTLMLDEVGELTLRAQAKLLRVLQEGEIRRVGENVSRRVDVRIIAATNRDLRAEVAGNRFRLDLLYRLDVVRLAVPPLRQRREDIPILVEHFWRDAAARIGSRAVLSSQTVAALSLYDWPGNVRELQNVLAALAVRSPKRGVVPPTALPPQFGDTALRATWRLDEARREFEERFVRAALVRSGGHRGRAAEELGVTRQGLTKLMARLGIRDGGAGQ